MILECRGEQRGQVAPVALVALVALVLASCGQADGEPREAAAMRQALQQSLSAHGDSEPPEWVAQLGKPPISQVPATARPWRIAGAPRPDTEYADAQMEPVRRLVYRVSFLVPPAFRQRHRLFGAHRGELQVDVAQRRLRARFIGPGWPVPDGSEVRLRDDIDGVYLFDGAGGRFLAPGRLATWFEGRAAGRARSRIRVRRDYKPIPNPGPGLLMCALLSEWTDQRRDFLAGRCRGNVLPPGFRFGPWSADLTAVVPMELPRRQLRADAVDPPDRPRSSPGRFLVAPAELERLSSAIDAGTAGEVGTLTVENRTDARVVLIVEGVPAATIDARRSVALRGLAPGSYRIGAMRPFGVFVRTAGHVTVPGTLVLPRSPMLASGGTTALEGADPDLAAEDAD